MYKKAVTCYGVVATTCANNSSATVDRFMCVHPSIVIDICVGMRMYIIMYVYMQTRISLYMYACVVANPCIALQAIARHCMAFHKTALHRTSVHNIAHRCMSLYNNYCWSSLFYNTIVVVYDVTCATVFCLNNKKTYHLKNNNSGEYILSECLIMRIMLILRIF